LPVYLPRVVNARILIQITHLTKSFKGFKAIDDLSLTIQSNEYVALLGPNGAGKTTLVEMIEGLQMPDSGTIIINGKTWGRDATYLRSILGLSLQETKFVDKITVRETLDLFGSFYKLSRKRSVEIMAMVGLEEKSDSFVQNLSGGQRQKLALGVALLNEPQILLLDEPTTGLDPNARREIWEILMDFKRNGRTTLILTTHYMEEAAYLCDRIILINKGKVLAEGRLEDLLSTYATGEVVIFHSNKSIGEEVLRSMPGFLDITWQEPGTRAMLTVESITQTLPPLMEIFDRAGADILSFESRKKTLDDLFVNLTGRRLDE
jgi:ABC-2 type transport system ATP-binding protein